MKRHANKIEAANGDQLNKNQSSTLGEDSDEDGGDNDEDDEDDEETELDEIEAELRDLRRP